MHEAWSAHLTGALLYAVPERREKVEIGLQFL